MASVISEYKDTRLVWKYIIRFKSGKFILFLRHDNRTPLTAILLWFLIELEFEIK